MSDDLQPPVAPGQPKRKRSATGNANFEDYFSANQDVATRSANAQADAIRKQATTANGQLGSAVADFNTRSGLLAPPAGVQTAGMTAKPGVPTTNVGTGASTGAMTVSAPAGAGQAPPSALEYFGGSGGPGPQKTGQQVDPGGLKAANGRPAPLGSPGNPAGQVSGFGPDGRGQAAMLGAFGNQTYNGPMGLTDLSGYDKTAAASKDAQTQLNLLGSDAGLQTLAQQKDAGLNQGESAYEAALEGRAGGKDFEALRNQFHPEDDRAKAEADAIAKGKTNKAAFDAKAADQLARSTALTKKLDAEDAAKAQAAANAKAGQEKSAQDAKDAAAKHKSFVDFVTPSATNIIGGLAGNNKGFSLEFANLNLQHPDVAEAVYNDMTDDDWARFGAMNGAEQNAWLQQQAEKHMGGDPNHGNDPSYYWSNKNASNA